MEGLESETSGRLVASFPRKAGTYCAIPVVAGHYYLVTVPAWNAVVSLDISDPAAPREASRVTLGPEDVPHWIAMSPDHRRVVITGYGGMKHRVMIARFDSATGRLVVDERFREEGRPSLASGWTTRPGPTGGTRRGYRTAPCSADREACRVRGGRDDSPRLWRARARRHLSPLRGRRSDPHARGRSRRFRRRGVISAAAMAGS